MTAPDFLLIIGAISGDNGESGTQVSFKRVTAICCEAGQEARFKAPNPISRGAKKMCIRDRDKRALFPAIAAGGVLPRKTFSMGEATEKRYYMECRRIDAKNP